MAIQNLRSSSAHKRPIAEVLSAGQIAINTNQASPGLFFKDSNGDLVKVGPVHIGTSAPNSSPATTAADALVSGTVYQILTLGNTDFTAVGASANTVGVVFTATGAGTGTGTVSGQQGNEKGELWLDTTSGYVLKTYDGTAWRTGTVTSSMIVDGTIVNADVNASAAIAGTKVSPNFGSQNIVTTGTSTIGESSTLTNHYVKILQNDRVVDAYQESTSGSLFVGASKNADGTISNKFEVLSTGAASFSSQVSTTDRFDSNRTTGTDNVFNGRLNNSVTSTIRANGSATFAGETVVNGGFISQSSGSTPAIYINNVASGSAVNTIQLKGEGSATFAGHVDIGNPSTGSSNSGVKVYSNGAIYNYTDNSLGTSKNFKVINTADAEVITFGNDGSATFAGTVGVQRLNAGSISHTTPAITALNSTTADAAVYSRNNAGSTAPCFIAAGGDGSAKATISNDGTASFDGNVTSKATFLNELQSGYSPTGSAYKVFSGSSTFVDILNNGNATFGPINISSSTGYGAQVDMAANAATVKAQCQQTASPFTLLYAGYMGTNRNFHITAAGAASFASQVSTTDRFDSNRSAGTDNVFNGRLNDSLTSSITANGSATFAGPLLINGGTDVRIELGTTGTTGTNDRNHLRGDSANLKFNTASGGMHVFEQNGTERMRIDSNGYVQIAASTSNEARLYFENSAARLQYSTSTGHIDLYTNSGIRNRFLYNGQGTEFSNQTKVYPTTDNAVDLGSAGNRWDDVYATNGTIQTSDSRLKYEVETSVLGTDFVKALRPVSYKWIGGKNVPIVDGTDENGDNIYKTDDYRNWVYESRAGARKHWGFIAQEVKQAVDNAGVDFAGWTLADKDDPDSTQSLRYEEFIAPLTKALQEAITKIETLEAKVAALEAG